MAAAGLDHHVALLAQDDVVASVIVEHRNGTQLGGYTAHLGDDFWLHQVYLVGRGCRSGHEPDGPSSHPLQDFSPFDQSKVMFHCS